MKIWSWLVGQSTCDCKCETTTACFEWSRVSSDQRYILKGRISNAQKMFPNVKCQIIDDRWTFPDNKYSELKEITISLTGPKDSITAFINYVRKQNG